MTAAPRVCTELRAFACGWRGSADPHAGGQRARAFQWRRSSGFALLDERAIAPRWIPRSCPQHLAPLPQTAWSRQAQATRSMRPEKPRQAQSAPGCDLRRKMLRQAAGEPTQLRSAVQPACCPWLYCDPAPGDRFGSVGLAVLRCESVPQSNVPARQLAARYRWGTLQFEHRVPPPQAGSAAAWWARPFQRSMRLLSSAEDASGDHPPPPGTNPHSRSRLSAGNRRGARMRGMDWNLAWG